MKKRIILIIIGAIILITVAFVVTDTKATTYYPLPGTVNTATDPLNVRSKPDVSSSKIASLQKGSTVTLLREENGWWYIQYSENAFGYCSASYIKVPDGGATGFANTKSGNLNVRSGPGTSYSIVHKLSKGETFAYISIENGWCKMLYDGTKTGYVSADYLGRSTTSESPNPRTAEPATPQTGEPANLRTAEPATPQTRESPKYTNISLDIIRVSQGDSRWATYKIGTTGGTIKSIGCLVTSLSMSESYRTQSVILPDKQASTMRFTAGGSAYWPSNYKVFFAGTKAEYLEKVYEVLASGRPVLMGCKTNAGGQHWVLITGYSGEGESTLEGKYFTINDPGYVKHKTLADQWADYPNVYYIAYYEE